MSKEIKQDHLLFNPDIGRSLLSTVIEYTLCHMTGWVQILTLGVTG